MITSTMNQEAINKINSGVQMVIKFGFKMGLDHNDKNSIRFMKLNFIGPSWQVSNIAHLLNVATCMEILNS